MATSPGSKEDRDPGLAARVAEPGYTPSSRQLGGLLDLVAGDDEELARLAGRAVLRIEAQYGARVAEQTIARARAAVRPGRGRLTALGGRLLGAERDPTGAARAWLLEALGDADMKTRRSAARALGKLDPSPALEATLADAFDRAESDDDRKVLAEALARMGGDAARERLGSSAAPELVRASLIAEREGARRTPGEIDPARAIDRRLRTWFHMRSGLEEIVRGELGGAFGAPRLVAPGILEAALDGPLARALAIRTATHIGFPLEPFEVRLEGSDLAAKIVQRLESAEAQSIFRAFTKVDPGARIRFRLAFARGDLPRALAWRCAELVREREGTNGLVNDPRQSTWEVNVDTSAKPARIELVPHARDERFPYRRELVSASSHPTLAAALARVAPRRDDDVVWDPFAGAGTELIERARLGPFARLIGTDRDPRAVLAARANLALAGVDARVEEADACSFVPATNGNGGNGGVTLILTNPPMGRRVERGGHLELLEKFVAHAARILRPGGALVWLVPNPKRIRPLAEAAGLAVAEATSVDMGGFTAELSVYTKAQKAPPRRQTLYRRPR